MNRIKNLPRLLCLLIALVVATCCVAIFAYQRAAAQAFNGKIAFVNEQAIYTINADGSGLIRLTPMDPIYDQSPSWSPDGAKIVCDRRVVAAKAQIYVMNADGSNPTRITNNSSSDTQPSWSPDGTRIAFISDRDGNEEIYVMNAEGSNPVRLTNNLAFDGLPSWSPDGTRIAFTTQRDGLPLVYVMNADGTNQVNITQSTTLDSNDAEWSPDSTTIAFTSYNRTGQLTNSDEIFLMNADGSNIRRLTNRTLDEHQLAWQPLASAPTPTPTPTPTPSPAPTPNWTISGTVTDSTGKALADVTMVLQNSAADTQIIFTDQNGKYTFHYSGGNSIFVTPVKSNFIFNPASLGFISSGSVTGDKTADFVGTASPIAIGFPILLGRESPARAVALDSVTMISEPFVVTNTHNFSADQHTRVTLFAVSIDLNPGEPLSVIQAQAEDSLGQVFPLTVEYFGAVPNFPWLKQVVVKLPDEIANKVEVRVSLKLRGLAGNKVIIKVAP